MGVGSEIYSGAAGFGRIYALLSAIIATVIGIVMFVAGVYIIYHRAHMNTVVGQVTQGSHNCAIFGNINTCDVNVTYLVDGKTYNKIYNIANRHTNGPVTVYYNPKDPSDSEIDPIPKMIGWGLIGGSILLVFMTWMRSMLAKRYKFVAAATGAREALNILHI